MRYSFRLAELLGHDPSPKKRPGTIKAIVEHTGLDRHQVAALLKNEVKYIPLNALSRLCDYLIEHGYVTADQLPGALFAVEAENFWELLARRRRLEMCMGVRRDLSQPGLDAAWVMASDSVLMGELLNGVSTLGGTAKHLDTKAATGSPPALQPHPEDLKQSLIWSPGQARDEEVHQRGLEVYKAFDEVCGDKAMIALGSIKSNPMVELVIAAAFDCEPNVGQEGIPRGERNCPFFMRYREDDPHPASCSGGLRLAEDCESSTPGIYFEQADGTWSCCDWRDGESDAALVFYTHRESQGRLEMVLGGFSGRATQLLARTLSNRAEEFWPPTYDENGIQVGAFVLQFHFTEPAHEEDDLAIETTIHALSQKVLAKRIKAG
ncbi:MAG: helix-turn-helix transcriptional regulator [Planctomycetes bacterium]|nr:helix-turn-helix transcriptional regulator [Planctomycetota bacterium]